MNKNVASKSITADPSIDAGGPRPIVEDRPSAAKLRAREAMLHGPIFKTMMRLALPTIGVLAAQTLVNVHVLIPILFGLGTAILTIVGANIGATPRFLKSMGTGWRPISMCRRPINSSCRCTPG
jgi:hypothetical protein